ncbi:MAG: DNA cytosine methyltransferase [Exiguobacterium sp.]|nr:DNA cytosine methyltransferase [Exiguobacterium sp.]
MKHLGDITQIDGGQIPVVDCITFGAPCQDISVAGKRKGMLHVTHGDEETTRSGLFYEAIRIVKEMREHDRASGRSAFLVRPRYVVYENVPGALSSNQGKDFQAVLTEIVRIADPNAPDVPMPEKKWAWSGCLYDDMGGWSVAWRIHDAQFWGVPQRRKRIAVVADFGGLSAPEILFERKGLRRYPEPSEQEREETAGAVGTGVDEPSAFTLKVRGGARD